MNNNKLNKLYLLKKLRKKIKIKIKTKDRGRKKTWTLGEIILHIHRRNVQKYTQGIHQIQIN